ncbi:MAG: hydrogenobyrinic acid a,c-diamide synthase (glutamine-hydrolyzing) [Chloroflexi bacterium]|nr:MAG: hydrogenobyrinic acid a,c-diamide synthase (glutamine-hydrolyzing) [Chloroflexota bacterium]
MSSEARLPRVVIAAPQGRSGKTTVSIGISAALTTRGLAVQPFKKGPDYIDPSWLSEACGRFCRSLDPFFYSEGNVPSSIKLQKAFIYGARGSDLSLIEGNHGLFDSSLDDEGAFSTAAVARSVRAPILLVVNTARMTRSIAAMVHGYQTFEPGTDIVGVVLNNVANKRHETRLRDAVERFCKIPVLGALPRSDSLIIPDRHLGLVPRGEVQGSVLVIENCRKAAEDYLDLDAILEIACSAENLPEYDEEEPSETAQVEVPVTIGVIRDQSFSFYYPENFEALEAAGARLIFLDALQEPHLPQIDALYIGGGFPEIFMEQLENNSSLRGEIRTAVEDGLPVYAECGGLMYLARSIQWKGRIAEMVGVFPFDVEMTERPQGHGYVLAEVSDPNQVSSSNNAELDGLFLPPQAVIRGHEFHHSRLVNWDGQIPAEYQLLRGSGLGKGRDGLRYKNVLASYTHLHAGGSPGWAPALVNRARIYQGRNRGG